MISISNQEFLQLVGYVHEYCGINLSKKRALVEGRLNSLLQEKGFHDFSAYNNYVIHDKSGDAVSAIVDRISTNHTYFMREPQQFKIFREAVLPYLKSSVEDRDLHIWSAGCSSGEEAYTLAMIIDDYLGLERGRWDKRILATDISTRALHKALDGVYTNEELKALPPRWKLDYFRNITPDSKVVIDRIKDEIIFRRFNLNQAHFPFKKKFHVIFCRNVMIYFDSMTRKELVKRFYESTEPGGYLFIGQAESLNWEQNDYHYIMPAVYRKE